jgi:acyl-CoA thioester hydrolase
MTRPGFDFSTRFRVRYAEIDGQKIVFNSRYLEYADVAITEYWRWAALKDLPAWSEAEFSVVRATVDFKQPLKLDDMIEAFVRIERIGTSSLTHRFELCHADTGDLHAVIELVHAHVDLTARRAVPITGEIRARFEAMMG